MQKLGLEADRADWNLSADIYYPCAIEDILRVLVPVFYIAFLIIEYLFYRRCGGIKQNEVYIIISIEPDYTASNKSSSS